VQNVGGETGLRGIVAVNELRRPTNRISVADTATHTVTHANTVSTPWDFPPRSWEFGGSTWDLRVCRLISGFLLSGVTLVSKVGDQARGAEGAKDRDA